MLAITIAALLSGSGVDTVQQRATAAHEAWALCVITQSRKFAPSGEPATTVVDAAMGECAQFEPAFQLALTGLHMRKYIGMPGSSTGDMVTRGQADAREMMGAMRQALRGKMLAMVMEERGAAPAP